MSGSIAAGSRLGGSVALGVAGVGFDGALVFAGSSQIKGAGFRSGGASTISSFGTATAGAAGCDCA